MRTSKIQVFLINGFLGSGKTTFLLKLLPLFSSQKCGVLMNEFGEIGIDGLLLPQEDLELIEINGGSIFCQCRHNTFIEALLKFAKTPIDILFIEASGLADPVIMVKDLQIVKNKIGEKFDYSGSICLIDSLHFLDLVDIVQTIEKQIQYASVAIINKTDLVTSEKLLGIQKKLLTINPRIKLIVTNFGEVLQKKIIMELYSDPVLLQKDFGRVGSIMKNITDISLKADHGLDTYHVREYFTELAEKTRRMKGFIQLSDTQWYYLDSVNGSLSLTKTNHKYSKSVIVVIFKEGIEEEIVSRAKGLWNSLIA